MTIALDFNKPATTDAYATGFVPNLQANQQALGTLLDTAYATVANQPAGTKRFNSTSGVFEQWSGSAWGALSVGYLLKGGDTMTGALGFNNNVSAQWKDAGGTYRVGAVLDASNIFRLGDVSNAIAGGTTAVHGNSIITLALNGATKVHVNATGMSVGTGGAPAYTLDLFGTGNPTINLAGSGAYSSIINLGAAGGGSGQLKSGASLLFFANGTQGGGFDGTTKNLFLGSTQSSSSSILLYGSGSSGSTSFNVDDTSATGYSSYRLGNGTGAPSGNGCALHYMNASYAATGAYYQSGTTLSAFGVGGLNLNAENASGVIRFYTGAGALRGTIGSGGGWGLLSSTSAAATASSWAAAYTAFGPRANTTTGAAFGIGYNDTTDASELLSLAPGSAWKPMNFFANNWNWTSGGATLRMSLGATTAGLIVNAAASTAPAASVNSGTAVSLDCSKSNVFRVTMTGNVPSGSTSLTNAADGQTINIFVTQDATGGRTWAFASASFCWPGGTVGVLSTAAGALDLLCLTWNATLGKWMATISKGFA